MSISLILRSLIAIFLAITLLNCKENIENRPSFKKEDFNEHYIEYAAGILLLPKAYDRVTPESLEYLMGMRDTLSILHRVIQFLETDRRDYILFSDKRNSNDIILIMKSAYVNFSKLEANQYLGQLEQYMRTNYGIGNYDRLQKRMTQTERSKYLKIKYRIRQKGADFHQTHYVVTSKASTYGIIELRNEVVDYEDLFKRINYTIN